ncbi:hypothetical protein [Saccharibacillus alkalitolerans]|uniref:Uncharacterized protein n=1 Tax=Saccharibacillus alkalitolerans TaxID=2705290 RepID=A0ABX0F2M9_9BACL|nr:hypothetical protein [Saccharibacillus alkalitolerans]NGZ75247.1 hypothetical protein [Saccharibacillus alkalitolerans]
MNWTHILGQGLFGEHGRPDGLYWNEDRSLMAVTSTFDSMQWSARDLNGGLKVRRRVSIYRTESLSRLAVLDLRGPWPINDAAFRPGRNELAIGRGSYDGGYLFEGELLLWDYENDVSRSLLDVSREVTACRFDENGERLYMMLRPFSEEAEEGDPFETYEAYEMENPSAEGRVVAGELKPVPAEKTGIAEPYAEQDANAVLGLLQEMSRGDFEIRRRVWDIAWLGEREIACVGGSRQLERWDLDTGRTGSWGSDSAGEAYELIRAADGTLLVNCSKRELDGGMLKHRSTLLRWDADSGSCSAVLETDVPYSLSRNAAGVLLARDCSGSRRKGTGTRDFLLNGGFEREEDLNLGHYDLFNHYLRIDGAPGLYFLQGTPASSHEHKWVCAFEPSNSQVRRLFPLNTDSTEREHLMSDGGCFCTDELGESLVLAAGIHSYRPGRAADSEVLARRALEDGKTLWELRFGSPVTAVTFEPETRTVWFALAEGKLGCVDSASGRLLALEDVSVEGISTVIMSLAPRGGRIAAGTIEGWILVGEASGASAKFE